MISRWQIPNACRECLCREKYPEPLDTLLEDVYQKGPAQSFDANILLISIAQGTGDK